MQQKTVAAPTNGPSCEPNDRTRVTTVTVRATELYNLQSGHCRIDGGDQVPVGNIP